METTVTQPIDLLCALFPGGEIVKSKHFSYDLNSVEIKKNVRLVVFLSLQMYSDGKDEKLMQSILTDST